MVLPNGDGRNKKRSKTRKTTIRRILKKSAKEYVTFELLGKFADMADSKEDVMLLLNILDKHPDSIVVAISPVD